ncbi:MAG: hypothetical protein LBM02_08050 [Lachnospiraceae bacterium]|jgi:hypothetical protein|nr:hypothetical protein [Lachnospiraceae bacterium]
MANPEYSFCDEPTCIFHSSSDFIFNSLNSLNKPRRADLSVIKAHQEGIL